MNGHYCLAKSRENVCMSHFGHLSIFFDLSKILQTICVVETKNVLELTFLTQGKKKGNCIGLQRASKKYLAIKKRPFTLAFKELYSRRFNRALNKTGRKKGMEERVHQKGLFISLVGTAEASTYSCATQPSPSGPRSTKMQWARWQNHFNRLSWRDMTERETLAAFKGKWGSWEVENFFFPRSSPAFFAANSSCQWP